MAEYADVAERYRLDDRIATGGMGEVWRGTDTVLDRAVAVKLLKREHADDPVFRSRFETEAQHAAGLHHPGVAQVFDFGSGDATHAPFLVMELVDGRPLSALLAQGRPMDPVATATLLAGAADALGAAHARGIVHRDVKPANLLVTRERGLKITDFGIARAVDAVALTRTGEVLGTPQYLSPEQAEGRPATPASDVYALGAVAFECLAGRRPYVAETPMATALAHLREPVPELPEGVPPALAAVVRRALAKDPRERYPDGAAFAAALREAATAPVAADPDPTTRVLTAPVPVAAAVDAPVPAGDDRWGAWRDRAGRVPLPLWAAGGVFVLVVAVAALANLGSGGGGSVVPPTAGTRTPSTPASASSRASSPTAPTSSAQPPVSHPPKPPKPPKHDHGHPHGHQGKGHQ